MSINTHIILFILLLVTVNVKGQNNWVSLVDSSYLYVIETIDIEGNKKTKDRTILRELDIEVNDTIYAYELNEILKKNRNQVYNLGLFNEVELYVKQYLPNKKIKLALFVSERFYWMAFPVFELADRNFNVWWRDFNHDFRRTKYGFIVNKSNVRGANENLIINFKWGYNRKLILEYKFPFIDKRKVWGLNVSTYYFADRELAINSINNEAVFYALDNFANSRVGAGFEFTQRKKIRDTHKYSLFYFHNKIQPLVRDENPDYFLNGKLTQQYFRLRYIFEHDARDIKAYPTEGFYFRGIAAQNGLGVFKDFTQATLEADISKFWKIGHQQYLALNSKFYTTIGKQPPYNNNLKLGFLEHFIRGYEYNVIDAQHYVALKAAFKEKIFDVKWRPYKNRKPIFKVMNQLSMIPIQLYLKVYNESAYSIDKYYSQNNTLNNTFLSGFGIGLDLVTFYDNLFSFDYTFNRNGQHGFFLHINVTWDYY